jgi:hypothetical protein
VQGHWLLTPCTEFHLISPPTHIVLCGLLTYVVLSIFSVKTQQLYAPSHSVGVRTPSIGTRKALRKLWHRISVIAIYFFTHLHFTLESPLSLLFCMSASGPHHVPLLVQETVMSAPILVLTWPAPALSHNNSVVLSEGPVLAHPFPHKEKMWFFFLITHCSNQLLQFLFCYW